MTRIAVLMAWGGAFCLAAGTQAIADPVTITTGSIVLSEPNQFQAGPISVAGTRQFSIEGSIDTGEGAVDPLRQCFPCVPADDFSVGANLGTLAISGNATLDGQDYQDINTLDSGNFVHLHFIGSTVLPTVNRPSLLLRAPFRVAADSSFTYAVTPGSSSEPPELATVALEGGGVVTMSVHANPSAPVWEFSGMRYDFTPTPEPSTLVLMAGALAVLLCARRRPLHERTVAAPTVRATNDPRWT